MKHRKETRDDQRFELTLRARENDDTIQLLRALLKRLSRTHGVRCVGVKEIKPLLPEDSNP